MVVVVAVIRRIYSSPPAVDPLGAPVFLVLPVAGTRCILPASLAVGLAPRPEAREGLLGVLFELA